MTSRVVFHSGLLALCILLASPAARAETQYVSDDLVLVVYTQASADSARVGSLHSGAQIEVFERAGEFARVQASAGLNGWVRASFLTAHEPAIARLKALEEKERAKMSAPSATDAATRAELDATRRRLNEAQAQVAALKSMPPAATPPAAPPAATPTPQAPPPRWMAMAALAALVCFLLGGVLGYAAFARRIKHKFGGIRVY